MKHLLSFLLFAILTTLPGLAQEPDGRPAPDPTDVASIDAIIAAISGSAGEARDWDRMRSLFLPEARMIPSGRNQEGQSVILFWSVEDYIQRAGPNLEANGFFETELHRVQERFGDIAHVFSTYESRRTPEDAEPFARGINSFQLKYDGSRWWIVNVYWQGENPVQQIPQRYLGG